MQPSTGEGLCYNIKRNDNGNTDVDGGPRGRSDWCRGHEEQGAVWTGGVRRVQSKCWPDTWERLDIIVFIAMVELIKKWYAGGLTVVEDGKPRTVDKVERYFQQTWIESTLGEDGGNVGEI